MGFDIYEVQGVLDKMGTYRVKRHSYFTLFYDLHDLDVTSTEDHSRGCPSLQLRVDSLL